MPVTGIAGGPVGDGRHGPITRRLTELYWQKHGEPAWTTPVDYG
jgi:branched-chain amino acid aminotransferase